MFIFFKESYKKGIRYKMDWLLDQHQHYFKKVHACDAWL